jgi:hypothetical protein
MERPSYEQQEKCDENRTPNVHVYSVTARQQSQPRNAR